MCILPGSSQHLWQKDMFLPTAGDLQPRDKQQLSLFAVVGGFFFLGKTKNIVQAC